MFEARTPRSLGVGVCQEHRAETMKQLFGILDTASLNVAASIDIHRSIMREVDARLQLGEADEG